MRQRTRSDGVGYAVTIERSRESVLRLPRVPADRPVGRDRARELSLPCRLTLAGPVQRGAKIVVLRCQRREPNALGSAPLAFVRALAKRDEVFKVPVTDRRRLACVLQSIRRVLPDRLQHPEALAVEDAQQALVDERLQRVEVGFAHLLRGLQRAAAAEDGEPCEQLLLL